MPGQDPPGTTTTTPGHFSVRTLVVPCLAVVSGCVWHSSVGEELEQVGLPVLRPQFLFASAARVLSWSPQVGICRFQPAAPLKWSMGTHLPMKTLKSSRLFMANPYANHQWQHQRMHGGSPAATHGGGDGGRTYSLQLQAIATNATNASLRTSRHEWRLRSCSAVRSSSELGSVGGPIRSLRSVVLLLLITGLMLWPPLGVYVV